ncbi:transposase [Desulforhopalus singaporensis]|uniref:Transposase zinc-ribbon domain-containing protein n=1 Tax=Desulforhopalus singaporensis TaxID=91360 RepID=A0A1H0S560_9BACT|nr:transposase [Desulforhopalus singaporensis]SDP36777.1 Transposase zinc-ribbon domain-containing protein [Desulforhopalus singaporensis]
MKKYQGFTTGKPFSSEQACVAYLFRKRWPWGFRCPFCGIMQRQTAPAYVVVCRYCRKQTSITANTLMHGSKKNLVAWIRVARQFCSTPQGLSARELQRLMALSCYQTAWNWLQKIRRAAAFAESAPCHGTVLFTVHQLPASICVGPDAVYIGLAMELDRGNERRIRQTRLNSGSMDEVARAIGVLVEKNATLVTTTPGLLSANIAPAGENWRQPTQDQLEKSDLLFDRTVAWLKTVYRGTISLRHLQGYLDEFCFRCNTSSWSDDLAVLDHLLTGLISQSVTAANHPTATAREVSHD